MCGKDAAFHHAKQLIQWQHQLGIYHEQTLQSCSHGAARSDASRLVEGSALVPFLMVGGTDNRFFRRAGSVGYGYGLFSKRLSFEQYATMFHGNDERVDQESLALTVPVPSTTPTSTRWSANVTRRAAAVISQPRIASVMSSPARA